jgi:hypothetical protein
MIQINLEKNVEKTAKFFYCEFCDYKTCDKSDFNKHLLTRKHQKKVGALQEPPTIGKISDDPYICICGKQYQHRQSLNNHKKTCKGAETELEKLKENVQTLSDKDLIISLIQQNKDLQTMFQNHVIDTQNLMKTLVENGISSSISINSNNSTTNHFNLNVFLNEKCKDAMNLSEFVKGIQMDLHDVEYVGANGYVNGISNILVRNLKNVELEKRPVHCTDEKRETFYIKENDVWTKEDMLLENNKMIQLVRDTSVLNAKNVQIWRDKYPQCLTAYSDKTDQYNYIVHEALGGDTKFTTKQKEEKIISKIAKAVFIDKKF